MKLYFPGSEKKVWWRCKYGHEWLAIISSRHTRNCPYCSNKKICEDGSNSLYAYASNELKEEWLEEKNGSMKLYFPGSDKKAWWRCRKCFYKWEAVIDSRMRGRNCPCCRQPKLELEIHKFCQENKIEFTTQVKYENTQNKTHLPYDASVQYDNKGTRIEAQGEQHYRSDSRFHIRKNKENPIQEYINRLNTDNKKSYSSLQAGHSFLSISYLCQGEISTVLSRYLEDLENYDILLRYHITPYIYLEYAKKGNIIFENTEMCCEYTDEMLLIYRIFAHQIESLQNPTEVTEENFTECCGRLYFNDTIDAHRMIHKN